MGTDSGSWACKGVDVNARRSLLPADAAGVVVLASVVAVDPGGWYPFVVAKFSAVAVAVVACWSVSVRDQDRMLDRRAFRTFAGLLGVLAVAAVLGRDPFYAWTGTPERHLGVLTWVLFFGAFVAGSRLSEPERLGRFARWIVGAGLALGLYTLIERWYPLIETTSNSVRLGGPYGSASFLGAALCLTLPVGVAVAVGDELRVWRWLAALSTALGTAALIGSGTRAAWLAVGLGVITVVVARRPDRHAVAAAVLPAGAVVAGGVLAFGTSATVVERSGGSTSRWDEWAVGYRIAFHHPWLGVGPEGYRTALADGVTASYERTYGRAVLPDRAHNVFLDVAAAGGVFALMLYAALALAIVAAVWRWLRGGSVVQAGMAAAALIYLVQQCFLFPVATIDPVFWLIVGAMFTLPKEPFELPSRWWVAPVAVVSLLAFFAVGVVSLAADRAGRNAVESGSLAAADRAVALRPDVVRYRLLAAELAPQTIAGYEQAVATLSRARDITPHDPIVEQRLADALMQRAIATGEEADRAAALDLWRRIAADDRNCYACHLGLGYAAALMGDVPTAIDAFEVAALLASDGSTEAADAVLGLTELGDLSGTDSDG